MTACEMIREHYVLAKKGIKRILIMNMYCVYHNDGCFLDRQRHEMLIIRNGIANAASDLKMEYSEVSSLFTAEELHEMVMGL